MSAATTAGDVVADWGVAASLPRPPLLVLEPLRAYLDARGLGSGPLRPAPLGDGHSNVTYRLDRDDRRLVLRRPPRPPLPPRAHDVLREARLLEALVPAGVRAPAVLAACDDEAVIGAPFYVMDLIEGEVLGQLPLPARFDTDAQRRAIGCELVDALAELHAIDLAAAGLSGFGRPDGYLARQIRLFGEIARSGATRTIRELAQVEAWLTASIPTRSDATVVHGDYRLGNVLFGGDASEGSAKIAAILDWEMAALGDPLADLGYLLATYARPGDRPNPMVELSPATRLPGFPDADELRRHYEQLSGRDTSGLAFYEVLALWRAAIFLESSWRRHLAGTTDDPFFAALDEGVPAVAREAWRRAQAAG